MTEPTKKIKLATLSCSYNRIKKTTEFLQSVVNQKVSDNYSVDIYLLDDNSPDGTADYVASNFPSVRILKGSGSLFWAGGMRTLWEQVMKTDEYDFYLLFNDDVVLFDGALDRLLSAYYLSDYPENIILGTVQDTEKGSITYGGQKISNKLTGNAVTVEPDEVNLKACEIGNANIMLVDKATVDKIGILSGLFTHGIADYDYTLMAVENDLKVWVAPGYYGCCDNDHGLPWLSQETPLKKRIEYLYSPKGLAYKQYLLYTKKHFPLSLPVIFIKLWVKTLFPFMYDVFKKEKS
ncbi:glycosyltransferase family 2 protein [Mucilaginibacter sp.]